MSSDATALHIIGPVAKLTPSTRRATHWPNEPTHARSLARSPEGRMSLAGLRGDGNTKPSRGRLIQSQPSRLCCAVGRSSNFVQLQHAVRMMTRGRLESSNSQESSHMNLDLVVARRLPSWVHSCCGRPPSLHSAGARSVYTLG